MEPGFKLALMICELMVLSYANPTTEKRPFYVIGHMVNSIPEIKKFLDKGANVLESDISFHPNGSVKEVHHGLPCECHRDCMRRAKLGKYLSYLRKITNPSQNGSYHGRIVFQFFDLKLDTLKSAEVKYVAGKDMADHVLTHLWGRNYQDSNLLKILLYINALDNIPTLIGFRDRFHEKNVGHLLNNVGYDAGIKDPFENIQNAFQALNIDSNVWQGDGTFNCISPIYPDERLKRECEIRNKPNGYIDKVYHWTIDYSPRMIKSLQIGVDGMITNRPDLLIHILEENFADSFRLATIDDDPFEKFRSKS